MVSAVADIIVQALELLHPIKIFVQQVATARPAQSHQHHAQSELMDLVKELLTWLPALRVHQVFSARLPV